MIYFFEVSTVLFTCLLLHIFFDGWFGARNQKRTRMAFFMSLYFLLHSIVTLLPITPPLRAFVSFFLFLGVAGVLYETTLVSALYSSLLFVALAVLSEYSCLLLLEALGFETGSLMSAGYERAIYLAIAKTAHFVVVLIAASFLRKNRAALTLRQVAPLLPCLIVSIFICIVFYRILPGFDENLSFMLVIALIGLLYINGIVVLNTQSIKSAVFENEEQRMARQHYEMQEQYYCNVLKDREETRALWHDLKKHVTAIEAMVESSGGLAERSEYDHIRQAFEDLGNVVDIDNSILNVILHHNIDRAKSSNLSVRLDVQVPPVIPFSAVDMSVIIGNTFDNAIEACSTIEEAGAQINVALIQQNHMLFYEMTNPCSQVAQTKPGKHHGYGLKNVRRCVEKYGGSLEHGMADGQYTVSIRMNCSSAATPG